MNFLNTIQINLPIDIFKTNPLENLSWYEDGGTHYIGRVYQNTFEIYDKTSSSGGAAEFILGSVEKKHSLWALKDKTIQILVNPKLEGFRTYHNVYESNLIPYNEEFNAENVQQGIAIDLDKDIPFDSIQLNQKYHIILAYRNLQASYYIIKKTL